MKTFISVSLPVPAHVEIHAGDYPPVEAGALESFSVTLSTENRVQVGEFFKELGRSILEDNHAEFY